MFIHKMHMYADIHTHTKQACSFLFHGHTYLVKFKYVPAHHTGMYTELVQAYPSGGRTSDLRLTMPHG